VKWVLLLPLLQIPPMTSLQYPPGADPVTFILTARRARGCSGPRAELTATLSTPEQLTTLVRVKELLQWQPVRRRSRHSTRPCTLPRLPEDKDKQY